MAKSAKTTIKELASQTRKICGEDQISIDVSERDFFARDLYEAGKRPDIVVAPSSREQVVDIVKLAIDSGRAIHMRGGGMSYSNTFLPSQAKAILLDMRSLNKIREINPQDLYVTVESGCTWAELDEALKPHGQRAVFWGPASGSKATIGGSMSQGTANNSSTVNGTSSDAILSYEIVTGKGDILHTGSDAISDHLPNFRPYGPDVSALFNADAGALGIKTAITLKTEPRPSSLGGVSFAFESFEEMSRSIRLAAMASLPSAVVGMDANTAELRSGKVGLAEDLKKLWQIVSTAHNPLRGLVRGVKIALAGRAVFEKAQFTAHFLAEAHNDQMLQLKERNLRAIVAPFGKEIPSAAISMMRSNLFPDLPVTHFDGRKLLPIHGIFPWSKIEAFQQAYSKLIQSHQVALTEAGITIADICSALGKNGLLFEPVFYWSDKLDRFHHEMAPDAIAASYVDADDNPKARDLIEALKGEIINLMNQHGAVHMQIGKLYPYMAGREEQNASFLKELKMLLDPDNVINPGALGLEN